MAQNHFKRENKHAKFKKKALNYDDVDYKDVDLLKHYIMETGRILPRRITKVSARVQRKLALQIRRARHLGLLEFCDLHKTY